MIKTLLNKKKYAKEVDIFRAMAEKLRTNYPRNTLFIEETHGEKGMVKFQSLYYNAKQMIEKEIADLLFIVYSAKNNEVKICFLQAKYHRKGFPFPSFIGDKYQWDLLRHRYHIKSTKFPKDILSFTNYKSITSYGVFFYDGFGRIDMIYAVPEFINPLGRKTTLYFIPYCPQWHTAPYEHIFSCNIDCFTKYLLQGDIGAPIHTSSIFSWLLGILLRIKKITQDTNDNHKLINRLIQLCDKNIGNPHTDCINELPFSVFLIETINRE